MGRKKRHSARTGDGGAELRLKKRQLKEAERAHKAAELEFYDDPSEDDRNSDDESESDGSGDEEEVLQLGEGDDDEEEDESDDVDDEGDDVDEFGDAEESKRLEKMDSKWGKSKKTFYSADTAEFELDDDEEAAKDEENAAMELQRKQATMMDDEDFGFEETATGSGDEEDADEDEDDDEEAQPIDDEAILGDQLADISMLADDGRMASVEQVRKDFSKLTKKDKLQIVNQTAPELLGLSSELQNTIKELKEVITPAIMKLKEVRKRTSAYNTGLQYLVTRQNLMLNYISNISFYLLLRAEGKSVTNHPVLQHLLTLKKQMTKLQEVDDAVNMQLHELLTSDFPEEEPAVDGMDKFFAPTEKSVKRSVAAETTRTAEGKTASKKKQKMSAVSAEEKAEAAEFYEATLREKRALDQAKEQLYTYEKPGMASSDEEGDSDPEDGGKRGATYDIIKNRGLKAHKSKLNRNPRVKKRMQYRKAVIRRKGQVRDVRVGEAGRYGGETTGIKSNLTRSRKIRN